MKKQVWIIVAVAILFAVLGILAGTRNTSVEPPKADAAAILYAQSLPDAAGKSQALSQWKGKTLVVNFWATWCPPCVEEMPDLDKFQAQSAARNVQVIGIGIDSADNIRNFAQKHRIAYPIYIAGMEGTELARQLGNTKGALPFTIVITPDGRIHQSYLGRLNMETLRKDLGLI